MKTSRPIPLLAAVMALVLISMGEVKGADIPNKSFEGLVIFLDRGEMQVKKGSIENAFQLTEQAVVVKKENPDQKARLALCQRVKIWYQIKEGKNLAVKIVILSPGYCGP